MKYLGGKLSDIRYSVKKPDSAYQRIVFLYAQCLYHFRKKQHIMSKSKIYALFFLNSNDNMFMYSKVINKSRCHLLYGFHYRFSYSK